MSDPDKHLPSASTTAGRDEWELTERITELESQLGERVQSDRVRELELLSLRHELELHLAYNRHLEQALDDQRSHATWYQTHVEDLMSQLRSEMAARQAAEDLVAAERSRVSYRVVQRVLRPVARRRHAAPSP